VIEIQISSISVVFDTVELTTENSEKSAFGVAKAKYAKVPTLEENLKK